MMDGGGIAFRIRKRELTSADHCGHPKFCFASRGSGVRVPFAPPRIWHSNAKARRAIGGLCRACSRSSEGRKSQFTPGRDIVPYFLLHGSQNHCLWCFPDNAASSRTTSIPAGAWDSTVALDAVEVSSSSACPVGCYPAHPRLLGDSAGAASGATDSTTQ
jgi:hypothetical protein